MECMRDQLIEKDYLILVKKDNFWNGLNVSSGINSISCTIKKKSYVCLNWDLCQGCKKNYAPNKKVLYYINIFRSMDSLSSKDYGPGKKF